jgi:hypothetical protein
MPCLGRATHMSPSEIIHDWPADATHPPHPGPTHHDARLAAAAGEEEEPQYDTKGLDPRPALPKDPYSPQLPSAPMVVNHPSPDNAVGAPRNGSSALKMPRSRAVAPPSRERHAFCRLSTPLRCGSSKYSRYSCVAGALPATAIDGNLLNAASTAVH